MKWWFGGKSSGFTTGIGDFVWFCEKCVELVCWHLQEPHSISNVDAEWPKQYLPRGMGTDNNIWLFERQYCSWEVFTGVVDRKRGKCMYRSFVHVLVYCNISLHKRQRLIINQWMPMDSTWDKVTWRCVLSGLLCMLAAAEWLAFLNIFVLMRQS